MKALEQLSLVYPERINRYLIPRDPARLHTQLDVDTGNGRLGV